MCDIDFAALRDSVNNNTAESIFERLMKLIADFEKALPKNKQVGITTGLTNGLTVLIHTVSYWNPDLVIFYGSLLDGSPVKIIQQVAQLNVILLAVLREDDTRPRSPIGFIREETTDSSLVRD